MKLERLGLAYRKAKADLYFTDPQRRLDLAKYEKNLRDNLQVLSGVLDEHLAKAGSQEDWEPSDALVKFLELEGAWTVHPKSIEVPSTAGIENAATSSDELIFASPREHWDAQLCRLAVEGAKPIAEFRLMSHCSIQFHVLSTLWLLEVGAHFDAKLGSCCYGNRLRRDQQAETVNQHAPGMFQHYFYPYRKWRSDALRAMQQALDADKKVVALTTDVESFYHNVNPDFMLNADFVKNVLKLEITEKQWALHRLFILTLQRWSMASPLGKGIPVGLPASAVIANLALYGFDEIIRNELAPIHYGRYVDDVILVIENNKGFTSSSGLWNWLVERSRGKLDIAERAQNNQRDQSDKDTKDPKEKGVKYAVSVNFKAEYFAKEMQSRIKFAPAKSKVFVLGGIPGKVLLGSIEKEMQARTSEWRAVPHLPDNPAEIPASVVAATQLDGEPVDNLRKMDAVALRRSALSLQLSDFEAYAEDLEPVAWAEHRKKLYATIKDHLLAPSQYFEFRQYVPRIIGLAVACGDLEAVRDLASSVLALVDDVAESCTLKLKAQDSNRASFSESALNIRAKWSRQVKNELLEEVYAAWPAQRHTYNSEDFAKITAWSEMSVSISGVRVGGDYSAEDVIQSLFHADLARVPFRSSLMGPEMTGIAARSVGADQRREPAEDYNNLISDEALTAARSVAEVAQVSLTSGLVFPTRPLSEEELSIILPPWGQEKVFNEVLSGMRGYQVTAFSSGTKSGNHDDGEISPLPGVRTISGKAKTKVRVAVANWRTEESSLNCAIAGKPDLARDRYFRLNTLLNSVIRQAHKIDYLVLPELALPVRWYRNIAMELKRSHISLIAGVEYLKYKDREGLSANLVSNEAWMSLMHAENGFNQCIHVRQQKQHPAWGEKRNLRERHDAQLKSRLDDINDEPHPLVIKHGDFHFAVLICSELSNINYRARLRGQIDALFVLKWNKDLNTFNALVESAALDVHCYVVQCNNRAYGDSRVRAPAKEEWARDVLTIKGGLTDGFLIAEINTHKLREFQSHHEPPSTGFKPTPEGFGLCATRRVIPGGT